MHEILALAVRYLTQQALVYLALFMTFGVFCWALWMQTVLASSTAGAFGVLIFLPILFRGTRHGKDDSTTG